MRRFWFEFDREASRAASLIPRCGVTAADLGDARRLLEEYVYHGQLPPIKRLVEDVDVSALDAEHVLRNMAPPNRRGVWYPLGHELLTP